MNRYIIIAIVVLLIAGVAVIGFLLFTSPASPAPVTQQRAATPQQNTPSSTTSVSTSRSKEGVQSAFKSGVAPYVTDNLKLKETVISGDYALQAWSSDTMGGEALLYYDTDKGSWVFLTAGGGSWSLYGLIVAGVPNDVATALVAGMSR